MAEVSLASFSFEENVAWLVSFVTFVALACYREGIFAVVATAARLAFLHTCHTKPENA